MDSFKDAGTIQDKINKPDSLDKKILADSFKERYDLSQQKLAEAKLELS